ncbi:MAG: ATPase [Devosia sp. 67-54]|uniref:ATPase n=1 Tax=unclassified Devosia TaxID=196773 RepID=UPI0009652878|nr:MULTISPECIES: ATPase [unclassified Devosia]MBN9303980.1 ATPase [Devosia sp.]OJX17824.1 MAG: ATPase [Devosia sp. 67-54]
MLFRTPDEFHDAPRHAVTVFGMAGVGKTRLAALLRRSQWFHYSVDYRIGTRHMGEFIVDNFKAEAMKVPFLRDLLRTDSIKIGSNITFANLDPLSTYLGRPGNTARGGLPLDEYRRRQEQHRQSEIAALLEVPRFIQRAHDLYAYDNFIADTGGSLIEVVDPDDPDDPVIRTLAGSTALIYIRGTEKDADELVRRFTASPKPMYYQPPFLTKKWAEFKKLNKVADDNKVDPDKFGAWGFEALLHDRLPRYQKLADKYGYTIDAADLATVRDGEEFVDLVATAIKGRMRELT